MPSTDHHLPARLAGLDLPRDLAAMGPDELEALCTDIRDYLITVMSETGGHLSPNLGVVELSVALHRAFEIGATTA